MSQNFYQLLGIRIFLCLFIGLSTPLYVPILSEISPALNRGKRYVLMNTAFVIGELLTIAFAYYTMEDIETGNWRLLIFCCAMLTVLPLVTVLFWGYESPRFLLLKGKFTEAVETLNKIGKDNNQEFETLSREEEDKLREWSENQIRGNRLGQSRVGISSLFSPNLSGLTTKLTFIWFSLAFIFYAIMFELPTILQRMNSSEELLATE